MKADLPEIVYSIIEESSFREILAALSGRSERLSLSGLIEPARSFFLCLIQILTGKKVACIVAGDAELEFHAKHIGSFLEFLGGDPDQVVKYPALDADPYNFIPPHLQSACDRVSALNKIVNGSADIAVLSLDSLINIISPPERFRKLMFSITRDESLSMEEFIRKLVMAGYGQADIVTAAGEFSRRGGIVDLFQPGEENPIRIEFSGNAVESIRTFDVNTQLSIKKRQRTDIGPASEIPLDQEAIDRILRFLRTKTGTRKGKAEEITERIEEQHYYPGIEACGKILSGDGETIFSYLKDFIVAVDDPVRVEEDISTIYSEYEEAYRASHSKVFPEPGELFAAAGEIVSRITNCDIGMSDLAIPDRKSSQFSINSRPSRNFSGRLSQFISEIKKGTELGQRFTIMMNSEGSRERMRDILQEQSIPFSDDPSGMGAHDPLSLSLCRITAGFELPDLQFTVHAESEIFGRERIRIEKASAHKTFASDFRDLKVGDLIVHYDHGIGRYAGLVKPSGMMDDRDFMLILYASGDKLYLPVDRLDLVQRYSSMEGKKVLLDRLGGVSWNRTKKKAQRSIENLAKELLQLYAERKVAKGHSFSPDTEWQQEFEKAFPYEETLDQIRSLEEIKQGMESDMAMDRLLCGDVGFGKTEVAMRAAFKAVMDGTQVAVLSPTTVLAFQHYNNFKERFAPFPITVDMLSRFRTQAEQKTAVRKLTAGETDIIIGTHRLLSRDVSFRKLGLLIVDEEQRFGVKHKEKLSMMTRGVDVLSMTATPIPRTLQMSLAGVRDISVIETPPANRMSIQTNLIPFKKSIIGSAIRKELRRGGQIYFVHNRVESLPSMASRLREICPDAKIILAHGKMNERALERTMLDFVSGKYDILLSTTIIENGLDIPRVNTIIINRADAFGLAQLYQLRGRVGRSDIKAYAYLLIPPVRVLTSTARRRLRALQEFSELGSGFRLAAMDLEIRGAGELLGTRQHGHIAALGFELYMKMLERAVREQMGEKPKERIPVKINLGIDARIPDHFIPAQNMRLAFYKRITSAETDDDLKEIRKEMGDRYGAFPSQVENIFKLTGLKIRASEIDLREITANDGKIILNFGDASPVSAEQIVDFIIQNPEATITPAGQIIIPQPASGDRIEWVKMVIDQLL